jgi:hypothetical protein
MLFFNSLIWKNGFKMITGSRSDVYRSIDELTKNKNVRIITMSLTRIEPSKYIHGTNDNYTVVISYRYKGKRIGWY